MYVLLIMELVISFPSRLTAFSSANAGHPFFFSSQVALLYYMGMAGHFALGNSNTLATIDVAGAFIVPSLTFLVQLIYSFYFTTYSLLHRLCSLYYILDSGSHVQCNLKHCFTPCQGLSSHSMFLSGILMFIITYASPMLFLLSMLMYISVKCTSYLANHQNVDSGHFAKMILGFPCLVPVGLNSILLTSYTIVLLLMRNHLFVWSVFSPK